MAFHGAQTFLLDPSTVSGAAEVYLSRIQIFFKAKPSRTGNVSGIVAPGVDVFILPVVNGIPVLDALDSFASSRAEYEDVFPSSDASLGTDFFFFPQVRIRTGFEYAFLIKFDGDEDFVLWESVQGEKLVGTDNAPSPGSSGQYVGKFFEYITTPPNDTGTTVQSSGIASSNTVQNQTDTSEYISTNWRALNTTDLKFRVYVARFAFNGSANLAAHVSSNTLVPPESLIRYPAGSVGSNNGNFIYTIPASRHEYVVFDRKTSFHDQIFPGYLAWQVQPQYPNNKAPATAAVTAGSTRVVAGTINFSEIIDRSDTPEFLVFTSGSNVFIREIADIISNSEIILHNPAPLSNATAFVYKPPVGVVDSFINTWINGTRVDAISLIDSNANADVRFIPDGIKSWVINAGGSGYSNTDRVIVSGYEFISGQVEGGANASLLVSTNSTGGITTLYLEAMGARFSNADAITYSVANSTGGASSGTGANLSFTAGMTLAGEFEYVPGSGGYVNGTSLLNMTVADALTLGNFDNPLGSFISSSLRFSYYRVADSGVIGGWRYHVDAVDDENDSFQIIGGRRALPELTKSRVLPSWSNELFITYEGSGTISNGAGVAPGSVGNSFSLSSNASVMTVVAASNNDFAAVRGNPLTIEFDRYVINNQYTNEHTDYGIATSRGISNRVRFAPGYLAEDLKVYLTAWKPANTDIKVYARLKNDEDPETFDDKNWTLLELVSGNGLTSSTEDERDRIELGFNLPQHPNTSVLAGTVSVTNNTSNVVGFGTDFDVSLAAGDLVRVYAPLFSNTNHIVTRVNTVTNATHIVVSDTITNNGIVGSGLKIEKVDYPLQVYKNIMNDNVARYYSTTGAAYDGFSEMQMKIILLSDTEDTVPKVDDIQAVGVTS